MFSAVVKLAGYQRLESGCRKVRVVMVLMQLRLSENWILFQDQHCLLQGGCKPTFIVEFLVAAPVVRGVDRQWLQAKPTQ